MALDLQRLPPDVRVKYREIAEMSGESPDTCYRVMLAVHLILEVNVMRANAEIEKLTRTINKKAARPKRKRG